MFDLNFGLLAFTVFVEMCVITFVTIWWNLPVMPVAAFALMFNPELQAWVYGVIWRKEFILWTYDDRRAKVGTWVLRNLMLDLLGVDLWSQNNLGLMLLLFWYMQVPYALIGLLLIFNVPLVLFSLIYNSIFVENNWKTLMSGSWDGASWNQVQDEGY